MACRDRCTPMGAGSPWVGRTLTERPFIHSQMQAAPRTRAKGGTDGSAARPVALAVRAARGRADAGWTPPDDAHGYASIDHDRVHAEAPAGIASIRRFLAAVARAADCESGAPP